MRRRSSCSTPGSDSSPRDLVREVKRRSDLSCVVRTPIPARAHRDDHFWFGPPARLSLVSATLPGIAARIVGGTVAAIVITVVALRLLGIRRDG